MRRGSREPIEALIASNEQQAAYIEALHEELRRLKGPSYKPAAGSAPPKGIGYGGAGQPDALRTPRPRNASMNRSMSPSRRSGYLGVHSGGGYASSAQGRRVTRPASAPRVRAGPSASPARGRASSAERHRGYHSFTHHNDYDDLDGMYIAGGSLYGHDRLESQLDHHSRHHYHDHFHATQAASMLLRDFATCLFNRFPDTETAFSAFDTNRTGQLSMSEFQAGAEALHFSGSASSVFWELDIGRLGVLTRREFAALQRWSPLPTKPQAVVLLARQTFSATFEGLTRDRTPFAIFRVTKSHEYERPGRNGDKEYLPGSEFVVSLNEATREISEKIMSLAQGDNVSITYEHDSVRANAGRKGHSERVITQLSVLGSKDSELLARQIFTATFEGIRASPESTSRIYPPKPPQPIAVFRVGKSLEYEKLSRYGDKQYAVGAEFMLSLNEATADIQDVIRTLRPGDSVRVAYQHNFVGAAENRRPERIVTHLSIEGTQVCEMLARQTFIAVFDGIRPGPKPPIENHLARPPSPVAVFKVTKSLHYEKPGMYGDKEYIEGMDFSMDLNKTSPDIRVKVKDLMPGEPVRITYQHNYVGTSTNKYPERVVVQLVHEGFGSSKAPEVLAKQMFTAVFEGIKPGTQPMATMSGPSSMSAKPQLRHPPSPVATFRVLRSLHYEKPGVYGDKECTEGSEFSFELNTAAPDIQDKVQLLAQGATVRITCQHQVVEVNGSKHPERVVTALSTTWGSSNSVPELLARQVFSASFQGIRPGPENAAGSSPAKPPSPLAVFRVAKSHEYERPSSYGDKEYLEGSEFMLDLNQASPDIREKVMAMAQGTAVRITYNHNFVEGQDGTRVAERTVTHLIATSDSPAETFLTRQTMSATFEGIRPGQDAGHRGHGLSAAPAKAPAPVAAFRVTESHRYEKKGTNGDREYMPGTDFLLNLNEVTADVREKVMALQLNTPVRFTYQQNSTSDSKSTEKIVTQFTVLSQADKKSGGMFASHGPSKAAQKTSALGPAWTRSEMEAPAGERDMGGWSERIYTPEQQARLNVNEYGRPADGRPAEAKCRSCGNTGIDFLTGQPCSCPYGLKLKQGTRQEASGGESALGPAWTRGEIERPVGERDMGGFVESFYTAEQRRRLHVDERGQPQAKPRADNGGLGPAFTRGELEPPAGLRDMGSWSERVYTEEQQRRLGVDEYGKPWTHEASMLPAGISLPQPRDDKYTPSGKMSVAQHRLLQGNSGHGVAAALDSWGEWNTWKDGDLPGSPRIARWNGRTT